MTSTKSSPALNPEPVTEWEFAEIWADPIISPPYILMLVKYSTGKFGIHNPAQNYKTVFSSSDYESAQMWLLEDEYERVTGQILPPE